MQEPANTLPMMGGEGPFGGIGMGGMFTILKVPEELASYDVDPGWYQNPPGTVAGPARGRPEPTAPEQEMHHHSGHHP